MDFSNISRQLNEGMESTETAQASSEKAKEGGLKQIEGTRNAKARQKDQRAAPRQTAASGVSYASEETRTQRELIKMMEGQKSDWGTELIEAAGPNDDPNHPYVDVMPFMNNKLQQAKRQMKDAAGESMKEGGKQAKMASESASNPFQIHFDNDGKPYTSKGSKKDAKRISKNISDNRKRGPLAQDPYKSRAGESD